MQCVGAARSTVQLSELNSISCSVLECSVDVRRGVQYIFLNSVQYLVLYLSEASCSVFEFSAETLRQVQYIFLNSVQYLVMYSSAVWRCGDRYSTSS